MTKTLNQIIFFPPPKAEYFFQQHWETEYFFRKKSYPPLQVKWSFPKYTQHFPVCRNHAKRQNGSQQAIHQSLKLHLFI